MVKSIIYRVVNSNGYRLYKDGELLLESDKPIFIVIHDNNGRYIGLTNYFVTTNFRVKNEILNAESNTLELYIKPV